MTLHVYESGSWEQVNEVHINQDGFWRKVKELYIKEGGEWKPLLFQNSTTTITATGAGTIDVPAGAFRARVTLEGGNGGKGGNDASRQGGAGGNGASITAVIDVDPFTTLSYNIASGGNNGVSSQGSAAGGTGGTGYAAGGEGGRAGSAGSSGGGGGGGGASSLVAPNGTVLMIAGGGGGGGGAGNRVNIGFDIRSATSATSIGFSDTANPGENGANCGTADGAGAGGGGAGVAGGGGTGGSYQGSYDSDGYPGEEGFSYVNTKLIGDFANALRTEQSNGDDGRLTIIWLPENEVEDLRTITTRYTHPFRPYDTTVSGWLDDYANGRYVPRSSQWMVYDPPLPLVTGIEEIATKDLTIEIDDELVYSSTDQTQVVVEVDGKKYYRIGKPWVETATIPWPDRSPTTHTFYAYDFEVVEDI